MDGRNPTFEPPPTMRCPHCGLTNVAIELYETRNVDGIASVRASLVCNTSACARAGARTRIVTYSRTNPYSPAHAN